MLIYFLYRNMQKFCIYDACLLPYGLPKMENCIPKTIFKAKDHHVGYVMEQCNLHHWKEQLSDCKVTKNGDGVSSCSFYTFISDVAVFPAFASLKWGHFHSIIL